MSAAGPETVRGDPEVIIAVDALGAAFATCQLYPTPEKQPVYQRAVETLCTVDPLPVAFDIGPGVFLVGGEVVPSERDGVERLAKLLFVHDIGSLRIVGKVTAEDLARLFEVLDEDVDEIESQGGAHNVLGARGVTSLVLIHRSVAFGEAEEEGETERDGEVAALLAAASDPGEFAAALMAQSDDPLALAERFLNWYLDVWARVDPSDVRGREEVVQAFVESFFYLDRRYQIATVELFLERKDDLQCQMFLDQFSGHELADLSPQLELSSRILLMEYARIATDSADGRPEELLPLLQSASEVREARSVVARRVQQLIRSDPGPLGTGGEWAGNLRAQIGGIADSRSAGIEALRWLLAIEHRPPRFRRLLRIWTGRVTRAVREGDLAGANAWIRGVLDDPPYPKERAELVQGTLDNMATPELLEGLVDALGEEDDAAGREILNTWGRPLGDKLVERLASEENPNRRRVLIDVLAMIARIDPYPMLGYLHDTRWYVVRNLAVILGRSGRPEIADRVVGMVRHRDHRVRVDALRALPPLLGSGSLDHILAALRDEHPRVRQAAITLLRGNSSSRVDNVLIAALRAAKEPDEIQRLVDALAARGSGEAMEALRGHAYRKVAFSTGARVRREVSRRALKASA